MHCLHIGSYTCASSSRTPAYGRSQPSTIRWSPLSRRFLDENSVGSHRRSRYPAYSPLRAADELPLQNALKWMSMSACEAKYFRHLRLGDIVGIYPADAETPPVRLKHNSRVRTMDV